MAQTHTTIMKKGGVTVKVLDESLKPDKACQIFDVYAGEFPTRIFMEQNGKPSQTGALTDEALQAIIDYRKQLKAQGSTEK